jgi:tetratricopeptide (TPR) repeat protein
MSRIFLSHSSKDNDSAVALNDWLASQGWDDVFLDLDPQRGIAAGDRWERAPNQAALRCEAVVFLVSRSWLASDWCLKEFNLAHRLNKRLFGLLIEDIPVAELPATLIGTWQLVPLVASTIENASRIEWKLETAATRVKIGHALVQSGDFDGALENYSSAIDRYEFFLRDNARDKILRKQSADAYGSRASVNVKKKNEEAALSDFSKAERLFLSLSADEPNDPTWLEKLIKLYNSEISILKDVPGSPDAYRTELINKEAATRQKLSLLRP